MNTEIAAMVHQSAALSALPANLVPALDKAHSDRARPFVDGCFDGFSDTALHHCTYGVRSATQAVVLFGDSHAVAWFPAFEQLATSHQWRLVVLAKATCPPLNTSVWAPNFGRRYRECATWRHAALARIKQERPSLVALAMNRAYGDAYHLTSYGPEWLSGLADMVRTIGARGARVVVVGPLPHPPGDVPDCLSAHLRSVGQCNQRPTETIDAAGLDAERKTVEAGGGRYLDARPWFCDQTTCDVIVGNLLVYRDENHLTTAYAAWLAPAVSATLDADLAARAP